MSSRDSLECSLMRRLAQNPHGTAGEGVAGWIHVKAGKDVNTVEGGYVEIVGVEVDSLGVFVGAKGRFVSGSRAGHTVDIILQRGHWPQLCEGDVVAVAADDPDREAWRATRL